MAAKSLTEILGRLAAATSFAEFPPAVIARAKVSVSHNLTVGLAEGAEKILHPAPRKNTGLSRPKPPCCITAPAVSAEGAAFANAALMNVLSQDDTHAASAGTLMIVSPPAAFAPPRRQPG